MFSQFLYILFLHIFILLLLIMFYIQILGLTKNRMIMTLIMMSNIRNFLIKIGMVLLRTTRNRSLPFLLVEIGSPMACKVLGRRRRRYPSLQAFVNLAAPTEAKRPARPTLRPLHRKMKAYDEVAPSHALTRPGGTRGIRPIVTGPARRGVLQAQFVIAFL
jgi:hypothetical protein